MNTTPTPRRALVIGAGMAGLLAARVLSDTHAEVVLIERDELPEGAAPRKGTPQAVQPHGLLARGREVMESLFPGFTDALVAQGALSGDVGVNGVVCADGQRMQRKAAGVRGLLASRLAIEAELRRRVRDLPGVSLATGWDVVQPVHEAGRVTGLRVRPAGGGEESVWPSTLVVDCSGRGSRLPGWLRDWGYEAPAEDRVKIDIAYVSAYFRRDPTQLPDAAAVIGTATPGLPRPSILIAQEPDADGQARWVAGLGGYAGDHVAVSLSAMRERALATGQTEIAALCTPEQLIGQPMRYAFPHSQWRHYERLARFPQGLLPMGDAIASFNPVYGQGMSAAACQALALRDALAAGGPDVARRYLRAAARVVATPWQLSVGADLALPQVQGERTRIGRWIGAYVARVRAAAMHDADVADAFRRVVHLLAAPPSLFAPRVVWRVLRASGPAHTTGPKVLQSPAHQP